MMTIIIIMGPISTRGVVGGGGLNRGGRSKRSDIRGDNMENMRPSKGR